MLTTPRAAATLIFLVMLATIIGAWIFEAYGYAPCELCLKQRWAYYAVVPLTAFLAAANPAWFRQGLWLACLILIASAIFGIYHSGVELKLWAGPSTCTGGAMSGGLPDLTKPAVLCDKPALYIFGLTLANYNAIISGVMAWGAQRAARYLPSLASSASNSGTA